MTEEAKSSNSCIGNQVHWDPLEEKYLRQDDLFRWESRGEGEQEEYVPPEIAMGYELSIGQIMAKTVIEAIIKKGGEELYKNYLDRVENGFYHSHKLIRAFEQFIDYGEIMADNGESEPDAPPCPEPVQLILLKNKLLKKRKSAGWTPERDAASKWFR